MKTFRAMTALLLSVTAASACSGGGGGGGGDEVSRSRMDVGGVAAYCKLNELVLLPGVTVTMTDADEDVETATTGSNGLWQIDDLPEGVYSIAWSAPGYETRYDTLPVSQPEDSDATFIDAGQTCLDETLATVSIEPWGILLTNFETVVDGTGGQVIEYDKSTGGDIVLTFDRPLIAPGFYFGIAGPFVRDAQTNQLAFASGNPDRTVWTINEAQLDAMNTSAGLTSNNVLHFLDMQNIPTFDPINGGTTTFGAEVRFRAVP